MNQEFITILHLTDVRVAFVREKYDTDPNGIFAIEILDLPVRP